MPDVWVIVIVSLATWTVLSGLAAAAVLMVRRARRSRRRAGLLACFFHAIDEGMLPKLCRWRDRKAFGDGWIDTYSGVAGTMRFRFSVTVEPWVKAKTYRLHLLGEDYAAVADPDKAPDAPFVRAAAVLRLHHDGADRELPEAS